MSQGHCERAHSLGADTLVLPRPRAGLVPRPALASAAASAADGRAVTDGDIPCRFLPYMRRCYDDYNKLSRLAVAQTETPTTVGAPCGVRLPGFDLHSGASTPASTPTPIGTVVMPMARPLNTRSHAIRCMLPTLASPDHPKQRHETN